MKIQRTLPPTAPLLHWKNLLFGWIGLFKRNRLLAQLEFEFREYFGVKHVFFVSSGKAALSLILLSLRNISPRKKVIIPGYTCFSVPSAVVKAGLTVLLCDVDPKSLDFEWDDLRASLDDDVLCVVTTHLLGLPANVERVTRTCNEKGIKGIYVIEDVAQAFGGKEKGQLHGTRGDVAFLSFGRGKNITCGSGGAILTNSDLIAESIRKEYAKIPEESVVRSVKNWLEMLAMQLLIQPWLYWFPAGLPFLRLGETKFYRDFPICRMDGIRARLLTRWRQELDASNSSRRTQAEKFIGRLAVVKDLAKPLIHPNAIYLRLPVLLRNKEVKQEFCAMSKRDGSGVSPLYPSDIQAVPELQGLIQNKHLRGSRSLSECLVTLPTHHLVSNSDMEEIIRPLVKLSNVLPRIPGVTDEGHNQTFYECHDTVHGTQTK